MDLERYSGCARDHEHPMEGMFYRPGFGDEGPLGIVCRGGYGWWTSLVRDTDICLDLGAHVGAWSRLAMTKSILATVVAVEPNSELADVLKINLPGAKVISAAVASPEYRTVPYFLNSVSDGNSTTLADDKTVKSVKVKAVSLGSLFKAHRPTVVKVDIEGAETLLLTHDFAGVRLMFVEYHLFICKRQTLLRTHEAILRQGFEVKRKHPSFDNKWVTSCVYVRGVDDKQS